MKHASLLLLFSLFTVTAFAQHSIPVEVSRNGHIMIKAKVNGVEGTFILDTGAGIHVISRKFFQKVKHHVLDSSYFTAFRHTGERLDGPIYQFADVRLEPLLQQNAWVGVYAGFDDMGFDGLIGCKLIENEIVTVDVRAKQLLVETRSGIGPKIKKTIPVLLHQDRNHSLDFFIAIKVNDTFDAVVEFDTGAGYSPLYLHSRYMQYAGTDTTRLEVRDAGTGFGKTEKIFFDKTKNISIQVPGTEEGGKPNITFKSSLIYDGLTSHIIFGEKPWTLDLSRRQLYLLE